MPLSSSFLSKGSITPDAHLEIYQTKVSTIPLYACGGYAQAVRANGRVYVSGQLRHDAAGNLVGAAPVDEAGDITGTSNMEL